MTEAIIICVIVSCSGSLTGFSFVKGKKHFLHSRIEIFEITTFYESDQYYTYIHALMHNALGLQFEIDEGHR